MKAKRLRALLVAGLLSLAPAVTLTSCGGGGGGGGGGEAAVDGWPSSLAGRTITAENGNQLTAVFRFVDRDNVVVEVKFQADEGVRKYEGQYSWAPDSDALLYVSEGNLRRTDNTGGGTVPFFVSFSINPGRLAVTGARLDYVNTKTGKPVRYVFTEEQCQLH